MVDSTFSNIGENSGSTGTVTVTGAGSTWANSVSLYVGVSGSGTLNVEHGGSVVSDYFGYVGLGFGSSGAATVTGAGSTWVSGADLHVGHAGDGTLAISGGGMVSNVRGYVGYGPGSTGAVAVTGAGSSWANSSDLYVGYSGDGALTISDGGTVHVDGMMTIARDTGSTGTLNIGAAAGGTAAGAGILDAASLAFGAGAGTLVFNHTDTDYVFGTAISGGGTINHLAGNTTFSADSSGFTGETIVNGGTLTITGELGTTVTGGAEGEGAIIGHSAGSSGTVAVTGADANWSIAADLRVGFQGNGTLAISDGGTVYNRSSLIGIIPGSTGAVTVTGTGSSWDNSSDLFVGFFGNGTLSISEGGYVTNGFGTIGLNYGSRGAVSVTGAGSVWKTNLELFVGYYGDGSLTISDGGTVDANNGTVTVARSTSTTGVLNIGAAAGDAAAAAGTLNASSLVFGAGIGSLVFNHTDSDYDFGVAVSGSGTISHLAGIE
ncbi:Serine protease, subtilase family [Polymorphum gilvum SL003B-26A1]|uniref:Serine protease, subtilase family n=1 Tax=Polymorphum gilvum (strain LMG 25793 / CGMCC 1.9160 / SL003B-26A1) TaxID=991905 RepID=F2J3X5_POLGS|nr:Serine protease, subtilase family [Polymorphum gilvum SL003B-26A1]